MASFIVNIADDYRKQSYGPFDSAEVAGEWCVTAFTKKGKTVTIDKQSVVLHYPNPYKPGTLMSHIIGEVVKIGTELGSFTNKMGH